MKNIGIAIDAYKLPVFKKHLDKAGFEYETFEITKDMILLRVKANFAGDLTKLVESAQRECFRK